MAQQALQGAQARLDQLQRQCDEAYMAYEANPSNDLKKERYTELKLSLHKAEDVVKSLATAAGAAAASGWQVYCPLYFPACILLCSQYSITHAACQVCFELEGLLLGFVHAQLACTFTKVHKACERSTCTPAAFAGELFDDLTAYVDASLCSTPCQSCLYF